MNTNRIVAVVMAQSLATLDLAPCIIPQMVQEKHGLSWHKTASSFGKIQYLCQRDYPIIPEIVIESTIPIVEK